jgi:hypothetical protein
MLPIGFAWLVEQMSRLDRLKESSLSNAGTLVRTMSKMEATGSSTLNCQFLGSLSSAGGRDLLSQLCLQIAQRSKLQHHFVERRDMEKVNRHFFGNTVERASAYERPFEMKVFFVRDRLERLAEDQVRCHDRNHSCH